MFSLNYPLSQCEPVTEKLAPVPGPTQFIILTEIKFAVMFRIIASIIIIIIIIVISYQRTVIARLHVTKQLSHFFSDKNIK